MGSKHQSTNKRVLVLEDERILRRSLTRLLEHRGHVVLAAASLREARAALDALEDGKGVDAAILDVRLPDGDGLSMLSSAGASHSLVISAEADAIELAERGVAHFLRKPFELRAVGDRIAELASA